MIHWAVLYCFVASMVFVWGYSQGIRETQTECDKLNTEELRRQMTYRGRYIPNHGDDEDPS